MKISIIKFSFNLIAYLYYKNWLAWGFWHAPVHHLAIFVACSSSWSWSWSWTRPTGVPAEGLGRGAEHRGVCVPKIQTQSPFIGQFGHFCGPIGRGKHPPYLARVWQSWGHKFPRDLKIFKYGWVGIIKSTSGASLQPLTLVLVRPLTSIEWPFPPAHFCLKSECCTPLPIIVTSQSFAKPNPTVQRMTNYYKNWLKIQTQSPFIGQFGPTSGASLQPLTLVLVRPLTSIEWPFPHAHFCLKSDAALLYQLS